MRKNSSTRQHWEEIYRLKDTAHEVSWYQNNPKTSVDLILSTNLDKGSGIIDVGGGDSRLVDKLLEIGFRNIYVLDISANALQKAKTRLGAKAESVTWIKTDILEFDQKSLFDIWHDRATFHFLTKRQDIARYAEIAGKSIKPGGHLIMSTFSKSGPKRCSGLDITQYSGNSIKEVFEKEFTFVRSFEETHITPFDTKQNFLWAVFRKPI